MVAVRFRGTQGSGDHGKGKPDDGECRIQCHAINRLFSQSRGASTIEYRPSESQVAESSVSAAHTVAQSAQARFDHGLGTKPEVLQAEQQSAQAAFEL